MLRVVDGNTKDPSLRKIELTGVLLRAVHVAVPTLILMPASLESESPETTRLIAKVRGLIHDVAMPKESLEKGSAGIRPNMATDVALFGVYFEVIPERNTFLFSVRGSKGEKVYESGLQTIEDIKIKCEKLRIEHIVHTSSTRTRLGKMHVPVTILFAHPTKLVTVM